MKYLLMLVFPKAKINLGLFITGKRPDGYHDLETLFYPVNLCDALELVAEMKGSGKDELKITGFEITGDPGENIVMKAVKLLRKRYSFPSLRIHLHKAIPTGAGLGGGSSDAAFALKAVNRAFNLSVSAEELRLIAADLGSDVPFFIDCQPAFATGRGELLNPVKPFLAGYYAVLVNPGISISTKEAYGSCIPSRPARSLTDLAGNPLSHWKDLIVNDFEKSLFTRYPRIAEIKASLYESGAIFSLMSGSGSTVYGIFHGKPATHPDIAPFVIYSGEL